MISLVKTANMFFPTNSTKLIKDLFKKNLVNGISIFTYRGYIVRIAHNKNEYLRLSCSNEDLLMDFIPLGNSAMNSNVIASYQMDSVDFEELMPTAEWDSNPTKRLKELSDGDNLGFRCLNLRVFSDIDNIKPGESQVKKLKMGSLF